MIVVMGSHAAQVQVDGVVNRLKEFGLGAHISGGTERTVIGVIGVGFPPELPELMELLPGVDHVTRITKSYKLASREFRPTDTIVHVGDVSIGGDELVVMAGPCSVENREQLLQTARAVKAAGARILRGGAFKPRTSPYSFQGLGVNGLELLAEAREETGLPIITEVLEPGDVATVARFADVLQIGARNMQNFPLLKEAGRTDKPIMLKRGLAGTIDEWLHAAEYVMAAGNFQVILCERGIRTFETSVRNTLDLSAVPVIRRLSHLPIVADPSHGTGKWYLVKPMALAALAVGAHGLLIEVHPSPDHALSDGPQSLNFENFADLMDGLRSLVVPLGRRVGSAEPAAVPA
ncbi:MAG: 3-deoxy-7-phosphoheptulonate synthase [Chloroflexi bacterium]|nr:3-deoxy-7-phosphoheptulonate synthase [Chloroflexota bacterium]